MLIDTSAIVAIMADEPDADIYYRAIEDAASRFVGAHVRLEAVINIARILDIRIADAQATYDEFLAAAEIESIPITDAVSRIAVDAYARFGKGQRHPAQLNFADCLSYACAVSLAAPILFKGSDFNRTDLRSAIQSTP
jgi:ribonuclease VapC